MKKLILIMLLLLSFAPAAFAHSHLESSTPGNGEVVTENIREIVLTFSGEVEQGSTFELFDTNRKAIAMGEIITTDNEVIGTIPNGLENDKYTVVWNIISADGHQMNGEFAFEVHVAETETTTANNNKDEEQANKISEDYEANGKDESEQDLAKENVSETENVVGSNQAKSEENSNFVPLIIVILLLTILIMFIALRRKK